MCEAGEFEAGLPALPPVRLPSAAEAPAAAERSATLADLRRYVAELDGASKPKLTLLPRWAEALRAGRRGAAGDRRSRSGRLGGPSVPGRRRRGSGSFSSGPGRDRHSGVEVIAAADHPARPRLLDVIAQHPDRKLAGQARKARLVLRRS
ncbi:hypothetical protein ACWEGE_03150 [Amycolatopsis sp. NPDC004747]